MDPAPSSIPQPGEHVGPYRVLGELGRGGMATVLEVEHQATGARRAIKLMLPVARADEVARRMEREFLALSRLHHPAVLQVYEAGVYQRRPWFAMEALRGEELGVAVERWRSLAPAERFARARQVLTLLAEALAYIHDQGLVHRDVTPSNIMLLHGPDPAGAGLRLMDFGVVKEPGAELTVVGEVVGTVAYIAPEQITGGPVDARADLYALGAVLYLMLTGRRPFNARNLAGYLDKHLNRAARPPRELAPTLPERLDEICLRLLEKDPDARFASARHLLLALDDGPGPSATLGPKGLDMSHLPLAGRAAALGTLREAVTRLLARPGGPRAGDLTGPTDPGGVARPPGGLIVVSSTDGMGKSRLAGEAIAMARQVDVAVTRVRGTGDPRPWSGFRAILEALQAVPGFRLPDSLRRALEGGRKAETWAVAAAARELVEASGPRLVVIDDAQRVDRASLELVGLLARNLVGRDRFPLLLLLTRDTGEPGPSLDALVAPDGPLHGSGLVPQRIDLGPLSQAAVEELLLHLVVDGPAARALALRLHGDSRGNPFFLSQMLRALVAQGVILPGEAGQRGTIALDAGELARAALPVPGSIRQALLARLAPVSPDVRAVLDILAIAREPLDDAVTGEASGLGAGERLAQALAEATRAGLVSAGDAGHGRHTLARHRLADVLVEELPEPRRRDLHGRLARALELCHRRDLGPVTGAVADHYDAAGYAAIAWPYHLAAARLLHQRGDMAETLERLDRGLVLEPRARGYAPLGEADRRLSEALQLRAAALVHLGQWEEGRTEARRALELARELGDDLRTSRAAAELGALCRRRHDLDEAREWLELALHHARLSGDRAARIVPLYELGALHWARGDLEAARAEWVEVLAAAEALSDERMQALGANGLGVLALCRGDAAEARRQFERAIDLCERYGMAERLVVSRINLIELHHLTGNLRKGVELADQTVASAREVDNAYGVALGLRYRALVQADLGHLADARENAAEAARMQRELGNPEEELAAHVMTVRAALFGRDLDGAEAGLAACLPLLAEHDTEGFGPVVHAWRAQVLAARGQVEAARVALDASLGAPGRPWPHQRARVLLNTARACEALGETERATALAEEALRLADTSGYRMYVMRARLLAARNASDEAARARHLRVGEALARSLAANLPREDTASFVTEPGR
ncbi:tetratricopeptide repeat protein [Myxococcota bacterium]|nr:tetratricopeptide repeat protein [Myxococcota bacterium]